MPWYEYSPRAGLSSVPLVEVRLRHGAATVRLRALVDSGADVSLLDIEYADLLGLNRDEAESEESIGASGAHFRTYRFPNAALELQFEDDRFSFSGSFALFTGDTDGVNLLGRSDFFQRFIVQFWDAAELMNIDRSPDFPFPPPT